MTESNKRKLRKDEAYRRRVELVQDLEFSVASSRCKMSADGQFLVVTGLHPPQVKVYDLSQLSMKFERHLDAEVVDFAILGEDYSKLAFLCADRSINFHAKFGKYYSTRTPRQGRDMAYVRHTGDLVVVGGAHEMYRLNLERGRFLTPMEARGGSLNVIGSCPTTGLLAVGSEDGTVECFDPRTRAAIGELNVTRANGGVTAVRFDPNGMSVAAGDGEGLIRVYDLRSSRPVLTKDHYNGFPIKDLKYHTGVDEKRRVISADTRVVKIWDPSADGKARSVSCTLVPIRPRRRGERRSLRTFSPGVCFSPPRVPRCFRSRHTSTPFNSASDAFELHPDIIARTDPRPSRSRRSNPGRRSTTCACGTAPG
jgi:ribosome biogenesis protein ENP2